MTKLDMHIQMNESRFLPFTTYKNQLKVDQRPKSETGYYVITTRKQGKHFQTFGAQRFHF
jgi:hypothetical protein